VATPEEVGVEGAEGADLGAVVLLIVVVADLLEVVLSMVVVLALEAPTLCIVTVLPLQLSRKMAVALVES
jgi:hypothetical protein